MSDKNTPQGVINKFEKRQRMTPYFLIAIAVILVIVGIIIIVSVVSGGRPFAGIFATKTPTATATFTPTATQPTSTPSMTPTITLTPTPEGVFLTVSKNTNCRVGHMAIFPAVTTIFVGEQVEVIGRNPENDTYYIHNPNAPNSYCWVWGQYATLTGNQSNLPVFTAQPTPTATNTPTPVPSFTVSYVSLESCAPQYALKFFIRNTGSTTWQSIKISLYDSSTSTTFVHTSDTFKEYSGCTIGLVQGDLTHGEESYVLNVNTGQFDYNPAGHSFAITFTLCSADGLTGTCASQSINITP